MNTLMIFTVVFFIGTVLSLELLNTNTHENLHAEIYEKYGCDEVAINYSWHHLKGTTICNDPENLINFDTTLFLQRQTHIAFQSTEQTNTLLMIILGMLMLIFSQQASK